MGRLTCRRAPWSGRRSALLPGCLDPGRDRPIGSGVE